MSGRAPGKPAKPGDPKAQPGFCQPLETFWPPGPRWLENGPLWGARSWLEGLHWACASALYTSSHSIPNPAMWRCCLYKVQVPSSCVICPVDAPGLFSISTWHRCPFPDPVCCGHHCRNAPSRERWNDVTRPALSTPDQTSNEEALPVRSTGPGWEWLGLREAISAVRLGEGVSP